METRPPGLWALTCAEHPEAAPLTGAAHTEVAIVGGGFTGLSCALHLARHGIGVHLLEAGEFGTGASGRNVGLVNAGLWLPPDKVAARLGERTGRALVDLLAAAPARVFELIEAHQIRCEATRAGTIHAATSAKGAAELRHRAEAWQAIGAPVRLLDRAETARRTGTSTFHGGLFDPRAGTVQPLGYARGLARAAVAAGATLSTRSAVSRMHLRDGAWDLETPAGTLRAPRVVLATNAYGGSLFPALAACQTTLHYFQLATEPLGARAADILPGGEGLWDTGRVMVSLRRDREGRIILGSMGQVVETASLSRRWADRALARLLPDLGPVTWESAWHGRIGMTPDKLPRIVEPAPGVIAPFGYNGRGIAPGTVFGQAIADWIAGTGALPLPLTSPAPLRAPRLQAALLGAALTAHKALRTLS